MTLDELIAEFRDTLRVSFEPSNALRRDAERLLASMSHSDAFDPAARCAALIAHVNEKFVINASRVAAFLAYAAHHRLTFNYHEKAEINQAFDLNDRARLIAFLGSLKPGRLTGLRLDELVSQFDPVGCDETLRTLHKELVSPTLTRKDSKPRDWSQEILTSLFAAHVFGSHAERAVHAHFDPPVAGHAYEPVFWLHLHRNLPHLFSRENSLTVLKLSLPQFLSRDDYRAYRERILTAVGGAYTSIANHGYLGVIIDPSVLRSAASHWELYADLVLYAEKHIAHVHQQSFFRSAEIARRTAAYIPQLDLTAASFEVLNRGFYYQDCFVLGDDERQRLLVLFQKHEADETLIPCPACRSHDVQGNSYSSLGVRSWECNNQICPDRSKFNRGKRYSFLQLLKQRAIQDSANAIDAGHVKQWMRDVQQWRSDAEIVEMLVRHYSLSGDSVWLVGLEQMTLPGLARELKSRTLDLLREIRPGKASLAPETFFESSYFRRYCVSQHAEVRRQIFTRVYEKDVNAIHADALDALGSLEDDSADGAVTSPPYYNAREYSQWDNIYTYLYDMHNINKEVFRVLRPGGLYLFNIFDYFDNEKNVSLSAMGDKRMILGAYIIDLFRRIGFTCLHNIVWDKGDIEGKRGFNNGNFSPYYQAPFNCWEHILVFQKPGGTHRSPATFPHVLPQKPVFKLVRGENRHGHTAPFPDAIPRLLLDALPLGSVVLDPFAGSMTTGLVAQQMGSRAICIEKSEEYFQLGLRKLRNSVSQEILL